MIQFSELTNIEILVSILVIFITIFSIRLSLCLPQYRRRRKLNENADCPTLIVYGSGGHTTEMLKLIKNLNIERYSPMTFILAQTDVHSEGKIRSSKFKYIDPNNSNKIEWIHIPRSREVKQSFITSIFTTTWAFIHSFILVLIRRPSVIICNGPGTCVPICVSGFILRLLGICDPLIVFVESFCRVKTLSLSGRLLYPIVDKFLVHWPHLANDSKYSRVEYHGRLIV